MPSIQILSEHLTNMIAAGEVVERPSNIVKECVENSIDAHAKTIDVQIEQGGIQSIIITDDGDGMDAEDAGLSFMRHATSKMHREEDLFNISTMGFRGEALASIAAVAHVDMQTNNGQQATRIIYDYGDLVSKEETSCPKGTRIEVSGLFVKTPARFKHLKSGNYEFSIIADLINKMALSHPEIRFTLSHDGKRVFQSSGNGNIQEILFQMYGAQVAKNAISFQGEKGEFKVSGYAIQPKINRATKYFMFMTMNTRLIRSSHLQKAILDAYSDYLPKMRYPIVVLQIETDTQLVDVNVHPGKWEIRISKQNELLELIRTTIKEALQASLQTVQIKQVTASPTIQQESFDFDPKPMPIIENNQPVVQPSSSMIEKGFESYQKVESQPIKVQENVVETYPQPKEEGQEKGPAFFDHLKVLAQLHDSYILCSNPEGLVIVDQHAAQERYHYEQIQEIVSQPCTQTQPLMIPLQVDVSSDVMAMLEDINQHTDYYGLHFEPFGNDQVVLREEPFWFQDVEKINFIQDLFDYFRQYRQVDVLALRKKVIATMACHSSIRFNRPLRMDEMEQVIRDLQKCKQPYHCPHGRPTVIAMSDDDLRKEFERG